MAAEPDFLAVAQILDRRIDIAVEAEIADARIGLPSAEGGVDLVAPKRGLPCRCGAVDQAEPPADAQIGTADEIGKAPTIRCLPAGCSRELGDGSGRYWSERHAPEVDRPVGAIGD
jgi:hypothetical protein